MYTSVYWDIDRFSQSCVSTVVEFTVVVFTTVAIECVFMLVYSDAIIFLCSNLFSLFFARLAQFLHIYEGVRRRGLPDVAGTVKRVTLGAQIYKPG